MSIYEELLNIKKVINGCGTYTSLGGSILSHEVLKAMENASKFFIDMPELHKKAGEYIANIIGAEAAYITTGAAAGLFLSTIACMTEGDPEKIEQYPDLTGLKNEVIIQKPHEICEYYKILKYAGAKIIFVGKKEKVSLCDIESAINEKTAALAYFVLDPQKEVVPLKDVIKLAHNYDIPVIVDAASELPPVENLKKFVNMEADLVIFSGGKDIGGPNDTGIICGKKKWVDICYNIGPYNPNNKIYVGRILKVSKEDVIGLIIALKNYLMINHKDRLRIWEEKVDFMVKELSSIPVVKVKKIFPGVGHPRPLCIPRVELTIDFKKIGLNIDDFLKKLALEDPPIRLYKVNDKVYINPQCLLENEEKIIVNTLKKILV